MAGRRRRPAEESKALLLEAAVDIIRSEGYAAVSARRLAEKVGLKRQIVHYHFGTTEELLLAVIRYYGDSGLARLAAALEGDDPLAAIWETNPGDSATTFAFIAMATHTPVIRAELQRYLEANRDLQAAAISKHFAQAGLEPPIPPIAAAIIVQSVSQALAAEAAVGTQRGHVEVKAALEEYWRTILGGRTKSSEPP